MHAQRSKSGDSTASLRATIEGAIIAGDMMYVCVNVLMC